MLVKFSIERRAVNHDVRVSCSKPTHTHWRGDDTEQSNPLCACPLERVDCDTRASSGCKHWIEQEEIALRSIAGHLEVVVNGLECTMVAVQADMSDTR